MITTLLTLTLVAQSPAPAAPKVSSPAEMTAFITALGSCEPAKAATPHPLMKSFVVEHTLAGTTPAGCDYRQTMPGRMTMACTLSEAGRQALSADLGVYVKGGSISGSTSAAQPTWMSECELEMPDGRRQPMVRPRK
jgi:hypothetical protein